MTDRQTNTRTIEGLKEGKKKRAREGGGLMMMTKSRYAMREILILSLNIGSNTFQMDNLDRGLDRCLHLHSRKFSLCAPRRGRNKGRQYQQRQKKKGGREKEDERSYSASAGEERRTRG